MAEKKEEPIVDNKVGKIKVKEKKEQQPTGNETKENVTKVKKKMKMKPIIEEETVTKVNLNEPVKTEENTQPKVEVKEEVAVEEKPIEEVVTEEKKEENIEKPIIEEVTSEEKEKEKEIQEVADKTKEAIQENIETGKPLPENIQKLMNFMEETGGDLNDYVNLNKNYNDLDEGDLLREYYSQTKSHLNNEEINFLLEDEFAYDEDEHSEKEIKRKKLALKEQVASAKAYLDGQKSKYYEDIKAGSKLTNEQQKAIDFFNRYNKESERNAKASEHSRSIFNKKTNEVFSNEFKGFEYNVGDKKFRYNVKDVEGTKEIQSDINNTVKKFLNEDNEIEDARGYHKSIFTAMNADAIANHFYEQGKADAIKDSIAKSKNVDMTARQSHGEIEAGGIKVRVLGEDANDFKFKIRNRNK
jgi:hypothetical protein